MENNNNSQNKYITLDSSKYNISKMNEIEDISKFKEITFKLIIIGDIGVGKSTIINTLVNGKFKENYQATIGFDIFKYRSKVEDVIININIWDTCGLIDFSACTNNFFKEATIAIIVYEIDKRKSFENIPNWVNLLKSNTQPDTIIFIVGNKSDIEEKREINNEEGIEYTKLNDFNLFIETSAKENTYVKELFEQALAQLYEYYKTHHISEDDEEEVREDFTRRKGTLKLKKEDYYYDQNVSQSCSCNIF